MTDQYRLLQLGEQLYSLGQEIRILEKRLTVKSKQGELSSEQSLKLYQELEKKRVEWFNIEHQYRELEKQLVPPVNGKVFGKKEK